MPEPTRDLPPTAGTGAGRHRTRAVDRPGAGKLLGGKVTVHSERVRGSTFMVRVAARLPDEPLLDFELSEEPAPAPQPAGV